MISDSEGDDYEDASEFGVDDSEMFGMTSSSCRKSPMSMYKIFCFKTLIRLLFLLHNHSYGLKTSIQSLTDWVLYLAVPENSENEADALLYFTAEFSSRWASCQLMIVRSIYRGTHPLWRYCVKQWTVWLLSVYQIWRDPPDVLYWVFGGSVSRGLLRQSQRCK